MPIHLNLVLSERDHKALADVLHHELDTAKWLFSEMEVGEPNFEEYAARIAVLEYAVLEIDNV